MATLNQLISNLLVGRTITYWDIIEKDKSGEERNRYCSTKPLVEEFETVKRYGTLTVTKITSKILYVSERYSFVLENGMEMTIGYNDTLIISPEEKLVENVITVENVDYMFDKLKQLFPMNLLDINTKSAVETNIPHSEEEKKSESVNQQENEIWNLMNQTFVKDCDISVRLYQAIKNMVEFKKENPTTNFHNLITIDSLTIGDLVLCYDKNDLLMCRGFGKKSMEEITEYIQSKFSYNW